MPPSVIILSDDEEKNLAVATILAQDEDIPHFPDGGLRAWLVVAGAYLVLFSTFGVVNTYGVFQNYYTTTLLSKSSSSLISLIGSLQLFLLYGLSPIIGRIFDAYGTAVLMPLGTILTVFSMMMLSLAKQGQVYQFFLSQGVLFGIGNALVFTPALAVIGHWFKDRRAYAIGIVASGSALGGVVYPIMIQRLFVSVGFAWAVRIAGFLTLTCLTFACITMRTRLPLSRHVSLRDAVDLDGFRDLKYSLTAVGSLLAYYALFIPFFYIEVYADFQGVPPNLAKYLISMVNALGIPARVLPGLLADRLGSMNVLAPSMTISGILSLALWLPSRGSGSIASFAALYGLFSGAAISLLPSYIATISPIEKFGARLGSIFTVAAVATLAGSPTAGAFLKQVDQRHFNSLIIFTGVLVLVGSAFFGLARIVHSRRLWAKI